jgi:hypothetical protein
MNSNPVVHGETKCRSCGAPIIWALTENDRRMPVDAEPDPAGNLMLVRRGTATYAKVVQPAKGNHRPHFATCPQASEWRR